MTIDTIEKGMIDMKQRFLTTLNLMVMQLDTGKSFMDIHEQYADRLIDDMKLSLRPTYLLAETRKEVLEEMIPVKEIGGSAVVPLHFETEKEQEAWIDGHKTAGKQVSKMIDFIFSSLSSEQEGV
jgi:hypothetical protein